jgi:hypothetical protein
MLQVTEVLVLIRSTGSGFNCRYLARYDLSMSAAKDSREKKTLLDLPRKGLVVLKWEREQIESDCSSLYQTHISMQREEERERERERMNMA